MEKMAKIERYQNWCDVDQLGGTDLKDGEKLEVCFPDNQIRAIEIVVEKTKETTSDMGHVELIPVQKAYYATKVYGVKINVPLVGLNARRVS